MSSVSIIDYGVGNVRAFAQLYRRCNIDVDIADNVAAIGKASKLILPGVGAFDWAMARLNASGLRDALDSAVLDRQVPVIGVCVGMQMMAKRSEEGQLPGLGWINAEVCHFNAIGDMGSLPLPHMGWNDITIAQPDNALFKGVSDPRFYFLHSYCVVPSDVQDVLASTNYGTTFASAISSGNIYATQFHPEKSHHWGSRLLRNFVDAC